MSYLGHSLLLMKGVLPLSSDTVSIFYSPKRLGCHLFKSASIFFCLLYLLLHIYIIIIMSHHRHGYPWPSLATPPYHRSLPVGLQGYIPYLQRAAVCRFKLVTLPLLSHVKGSSWVHHLWARLYFSSSVPHVWFI